VSLPLYPRALGFEWTWHSKRGLNFAGQELRILAVANASADFQHGGEPAPSGPFETALEHSAGQACFGGSLFTTVDGRLGIGPASVEPDDNICILLRYKAPVLLRSQNKDFCLMDEARLDGFVHREALPIPSIDSSMPIVAIKTF
jgi:hypothetical protein